VARSSNGAISVDRAGAGVDAKTSNGSIRIGEVTRGSVVLGTPAGNLGIGIAEGTATRLEVNTGHGNVHKLLENATRPEEAHETVEARGYTSYGDITIRRSRLASGTGEEGATMIINQSRPAIAATGLRRLVSAIERAGGEDTGSEGASR
jgi:hypothetical protein